MRILIPALAALVLLAPAAVAGTAQHIIYLHENPLHALPESIVAKRGDTLEFTIENPVAEGKTPHNFLVCGDGVSPLENCDDRWAFTGMIQPGESAKITFEAKRAGSFDYFCYIPGHKGGGMRGTLIIQGEAEEKALPLGPMAFAGLAAAALIAVRRRAA